VFFLIGPTVKLSASLRQSNSIAILSKMPERLRSASQLRLPLRVWMKTVDSFYQGESV
jgi:hypothetical protein